MPENAKTCKYKKEDKKKIKEQENTETYLSDNFHFMGFEVFFNICNMIIELIFVPYS